MAATVPTAVCFSSTVKVASELKAGESSSSIIVMVAVLSPIAVFTGLLKVIVKVSSSSSPCVACLY